MAENDITIAMWGPKGSGKTCLIYSFGYTITHIYAGDQDGLTFVLTDGDGQEVQIDAPNKIDPIVKGTQNPTGINWQISREHIDPNSERQYRYAISSYLHWLYFVDDQGSLLDGMLDEKNITPEVEFARSRILRAPNIIILLDHDLLVRSNTAVSGNRMTKEDYHQKILNLFRLLNQEAFTRRIAVCLTKADKFDDGMRKRAQTTPKKAWELIVAFFGSEMEHSFKVQAKRHTIRPFVISSKMDGIDDRWMPDGVQWPFFWLLEETERDKIRSSFSSSPLKTISNWLFINERENEYIPYPKMEWGRLKKRQNK